jgi:hypothetical protein
MDTGAPEVGRAVALWKRIAIRAAIGGATFGVVIVTGAAVAEYVANHSNEWNDLALRVVRSEAHPLMKLNRDFGDESSGIAIDVDLQNTTPTDITVARNVDVLAQVRNTHVLKRTSFVLAEAYFIPAHHTVSVSLTASGSCGPKAPPRECYDSYFLEADSLVIFNVASRFKINILKPKLIEDSPTRLELPQ